MHRNKEPNRCNSTLTSAKYAMATLSPLAWIFARLARFTQWKQSAKHVRSQLASALSLGTSKGIDFNLI